MKSFVFPGNIESDILEIGSKQIPYMRTAWFSQLVLDCETMLLNLLECPGGKVIPYTASGTAAMESCITGFVKQQSKALVLNGGTFGKRWGDLCNYHGVDYDEIPVAFGRAPDMEALREKLLSGEYGTLLMQHHETSSGYLYDLETISAWCKASNTRLVVDAISSFLTDDFSMSRHGVDIAVLSSQKGLNLPPGLSFVILSESALQQGPFAPGVYYYDWETQLDNLRRGQTPYSPATQLFMQLHERLKQVSELGMEQVIGRVAERARAFRAECQRYGWEFTADHQSNCITGVYLPCKARPVVNELLNQNIYVMPSGHDHMIRVSHLGTLTPQDDIDLATELLQWTNKAK
jgi:aspartate aminotransferase-like enzyme